MRRTKRAKTSSSNVLLNELAVDGEIAIDSLRSDIESSIASFESSVNRVIEAIDPRIRSMTIREFIEDHGGNSNHVLSSSIASMETALNEWNTARKTAKKRRGREVTAADLPQGFSMIPEPPTPLMSSASSSALVAGGASVATIQRLTRARARMVPNNNNNNNGNNNNNIVPPTPATIKKQTTQQSVFNGTAATPIAENKRSKRRH